ncbi:unnamed protein product, partial [Oikopleura dioica]
MDKSDDSILTRDIEYNDSISALDSAPRVPLLDPYDLFESNTAEIEEIKQALPKCDDSGTQLDTTSQLPLLQISLNMFTTGDLQSKLKTPSTINYNEDLFADLDGVLDSKKDKSNRPKGLATTGNKRIITYGNMSKISEVSDKINVDKEDDDSFEFSQELTSQYFMPAETQKTSKNIAKSPEKPNVLKIDNDDEFDFSMCKKPSKNTFKPPSTLNKTSSKSVESAIVKQFYQSGSTSLFTTGTGSSICLPGLTPLNNSKVSIPASVVFASPKIPLEEKKAVDKKAFAADEGRKQPLVEISPNLLANKSPVVSTNDSLENSLSQCLFNSVSPVYKPKAIAETKKEPVNKLSKNIFKGLNEITTDDVAPNKEENFLKPVFQGFKTGLGAPAKIDPAALKAVRDCNQEKSQNDQLSDAAKKSSFPGFKTFGSHGGDVKIDNAAIKHVQNFLSTDTVSTPTFSGFQTALGNPMEIDKKATEVVKSTLDGSEAYAKGSGFGGFQTAHGVPMKVDEKALQAVKGTLNAHPNTTESGFSGFKTGLGAKVKTDESALKFIKDQERSYIETNATQNTTAENLNAKLDLLLSATSSKSNVITPEVQPILDLEVTSSSLDRSISPSIAFFENIKKDLQLKSENLMPKTANELQEAKLSLPRPEFMIKPSLKRKSDETDAPAKKPKRSFMLEYSQEKLDIMRAQILLENCRYSINLPPPLRRDPPELEYIEETEDKNEYTIKEATEKESTENRSERVEEPCRIYLPWASFVNPESDSSLYRLTLIAYELELKERRSSFLKRQNPCISFAVPVKAPKNISKHSTPKVGLSLK